ncbi:hypothetical protein [Salinimicrobium sp. TH3]|uniref:hypothetical protein n=1 Tax=Salinimicrobium sp. TH3 TaxID=2997342 RepID=UPI00227624F0|nr:hypothetical protein [Salinimicrobium sp. TH3]MCY2687105.1 hypothetical protein [Salinimicrobium sp. TH3]
MYLFVFTILLAVIFYVNGSKLVESKDQEIEALKEQLEEQNSGVDNLAETTLQEDTFSLVSNEEALSYLENRGFDPAEIIKKVEEALISRNTAEEDNELVPYEGMNGPFRINKVKLLNHKWAIASFTDGSFWGDLLVSFEIDEEGKVEVFSEKALLYPQN